MLGYKVRFPLEMSLGYFPGLGEGGSRENFVCSICLSDFLFLVTCGMLSFLELRLEHSSIRNRFSGNGYNLLNNF